jgi:hypothetical protein
MSKRHTARAVLVVLVWQSAPTPPDSHIATLARSQDVA